MPPHSAPNWASWDLKTKRLSLADLEGIPLEQLQQMRGVVFGKHGRIFKEKNIQEFLEHQPWYKPNPDFSNGDLSDIDIANLDLIRKKESELHTFVQPGDLRFWRDRTFTVAQLGSPTLTDLRIMRAEILAIHGRMFEYDPELQSYFEERYWYVCDETTWNLPFTKQEMQNFQTLMLAEEKLRNVNLIPGDLPKFANGKVSPHDIQGLSLVELRLLRNEFYARKGRKFKTYWLAKYFESQPWYKPSGGYKDPDLSTPEQSSLDVILHREAELHASLSTEKFDPSLLAGLYAEDAAKLRSEIYARHGKRFKEEWLQSYFQAQPWYKPNPNYNEKSVSEIERRNAGLIAQYEKKAIAEVKAVEG